MLAILVGPSQTSSLANFGLCIPQTWRRRGRSLWYLTQRPLPSWIRNSGKALVEGSAPVSSDWISSGSWSSFNTCFRFWVSVGNASSSAGVIGVADCADRMAELRVSSDVSERPALEVVPFVCWLSAHSRFSFCCNIAA